MKWISVKKRLPQGFWTTRHQWLSEDVLFCNDVGMFIGRYNRENGYWETGEPADENWVDDVRYWMSLPKMPKEFLE